MENITERPQILEHYQKLKMGAMEVYGSQESISALTQEINGNSVVSKMSELFEKVNQRAASKISSPKFLRSDNRLFDEQHPCPVVVAQDHQEFIRLDNLAGGNLPEWVGVFARIYDNRLFVVYNLDYINQAISGKGVDFDYFRQEFGHEVADVWTVEVMAVNSIPFWLSLPYWLRDGVSEYLARETPLSEFQELLERKALISITNLEESFFQYDRERTDRNICYQGCRWFIDYVACKTEGVDTILEAVQVVKKQGITIYQAFLETTGLDFFELEREWWNKLGII